MPGLVFENVSVDYAGPVYLKYGHVRNPTIIKAYICVLVSLSVKAVHLELVSDLITDAFIATLSLLAVENHRQPGVIMVPTSLVQLERSRNSFSSCRNKWSKEPYQNSVLRKALYGNSCQNALHTLVAYGRQQSKA